jgi:hypothetical protein
MTLHETLPEGPLKQIAWELDFRSERVNPSAKAHVLQPEITRTACLAHVRGQKWYKAYKATFDGFPPLRKPTAPRR